MIATGHVEHLVTNGFEENTEKTRYRLEKALDSLNKLTEKLHERRKVLKSYSGEIIK